MKQATVAKLQGVSRSYVNEISKETKVPNTARARRIKAMLEISEYDFLSYFFTNEAMLSICDNAIVNLKKAKEKKLAFELRRAVEIFIENNKNGKTK